MMKYDVVIVGAGAAGLFCAASHREKVNGLILEKTGLTGTKLLMSGGGQCNLTHGGDIKDFIGHYGDNGKKIRSMLYKFNNRAVAEFFSDCGVPVFERADGKIFPKSMNAKDVLNALKKKSAQNGFDLLYRHTLTEIKPVEGGYEITCSCGDGKEPAVFETTKLVIACGGCSYPTTGSDGRVLSILEEMGLETVKPKPALVPIFVNDYPYGDLSGISFSPAAVKAAGKEVCGDLLFTHGSFSGPAILNISRYIQNGDTLTINYFPGKTGEMLLSEFKQQMQGNSKQAAGFFADLSQGSLPKRFTEILCKRADIGEERKAATLNGKELRRMAELMTMDTFTISGTAGFANAMTTAGGVALGEIDLKTMESKKYPNLFLIGEILDADGDTGGYNLQFAFSGGALAGSK